MVPNRIIAAAGVCALLISPATAFAQPRDIPRWQHPPRAGYYAPRHHAPAPSGWRVRSSLVERVYTPVFVGPSLYYYNDGSFYYFSGTTYVPVRPPYGVVVRTIPAHCRLIRAHGATYFVDNGVYYTAVPAGYRVVAPPVVYETTAVQEKTTMAMEGSLLGGVLGAVLGGVIGHQQKGDHTAGGALVGGVAGAVAGGVLGSRVPDTGVVSSAPVAATETVAVTTSPSAAAAASFTVYVPGGKGGYVPVVLRRNGTGYTGPQGEFYPDFPAVAQLQAMYGGQ